MIISRIKKIHKWNINKTFNLIVFFFFSTWAIFGVVLPMLIKSNSVKCWLWLKAIEMPHLCFSQHKRCSHFKAFRSGQIFVKLELVFQLQQLLTGEGGARPAALAQQAGLRARCSTQDTDKRVCEEKTHQLWQVTQHKAFFSFQVNIVHFKLF